MNNMFKLFDMDFYELKSPLIEIFKFFGDIKNI